MAWIYLAASAESQQLWHPGCDQSPTVKSTNTAVECCCREWRLGMFQSHQSGTTLHRYDGPCYQTDQSTSSTADSPARISVLRAMVRAWLASAAAWFSRYFGSSVKSGRPSFSSKTCRPLGPAAENEWSKNWPRSGMTVDGTCYPLTTWERRTRGNAGSSWPTPRAADAEKNQRSMSGILNEVARKGAPQDLISAVRLRPTQSAVRVETPAGGQLNPQWIEWLMGYPLGWTVSEPWAMPLSPPRRGKRSAG